MAVRKDQGNLQGVDKALVEANLRNLEDPWALSRVGI